MPSIDFNALLSAVKPKERTDQYLVLAALFHLGALTSPVTASQVKQLLQLHCGKNTPQNIPDCLRKYTAYVQPAAKGPPLLWSLTSKGLERLRTLSDLALSVVADEQAFATDIGIICALELPELAAVIVALGGAQAWKEVGNARYAHVYRESTLVTNQRKQLRVVATTSTSMGLTAAAIATTQLVLQFRPRIVLMTGIAAGTRSGNKQFGDVLVC